MTAIQEDKQGNLWLGAPKGVFWVPKKELIALARGEASGAPFHLAGEAEGDKPGRVGFGSQPASARAARSRKEGQGRPEASCGAT